MSAALLQAAVDHIRTGFTRQEVATVQVYGGEFSAAEVPRLSFSCPAVLVTVLRGKHARAVRLAAFVVTKHVRREDRMAEAMTIAGRLCVLLRRWVPANSLPINAAPLNDAPTAENLYGRAVDEQGLALWLVDWTQDAEPMPGEGAELFDLMRVDIEDTTQQGQVAAPGPGPAGLVVTERVDFNTPI